MSRIMVDLETMGTGPDAAIIQIGAVKFDLENGLGPDFFADVNLATSMKWGGTVDAATIAWWMQQPNRLDAITGNYELMYALKEFDHFLPEECEIWANGANFDPVILTSAYKAVHAPTPFKFFRVRCARTIYALASERGWKGREGVKAHNALQDAKDQATDLIKALKFL